MSLVLDPRKSRTDSSERVAAGLAQVNLLSPETRAAHAFAGVKRLLVAGLAAVVAIVLIAFGVANVQAASAERNLTDAQADTNRLLTEQKKYAEVPKVLTRLEALSSAREMGFSTEVLWTPYLYAIFAVLPQDVRITSFDIGGATPMLASAAPADPLQGPSLETVKFSGRSRTIPDAAAWVDALNSIPGFEHAWVSSAVIAENSDDGVFYEVQSSVQVNSAALSQRFAKSGGN